MVIGFQHAALDKGCRLGHFRVNEHELGIILPILLKHLLLDL